MMGQYLHIVFCLSPTNLLFTELCSKYPGLVTHSTVDFFDEWSAKALYGVAYKEISRYVSKSDLGEALTVGYSFIANQQLHVFTWNSLFRKCAHKLLHYVLKYIMLCYPLLIRLKASSRSPSQWHLPVLFTLSKLSVKCFKSNVIRSQTRGEYAWYTSFTFSVL